MSQPLREEKRTVQCAVHQHGREVPTLPGGHIHHLCGHPLALHADRFHASLRDFLVSVRLGVLGHRASSRWPWQPGGGWQLHALRAASERLHRGVPVLHRDANDHRLRFPLRDGRVSSRGFSRGLPVHRGQHHRLLHDRRNHGQNGTSQEASTDSTVLA